MPKWKSWPWSERPAGRRKATRQNAVTVTDQQTDALVREFRGLTRPEEIALVENAQKS
jgi:hypothetical protein